MKFSEARNLYTMVKNYQESNSAEEAIELTSQKLGLKPSLVSHVFDLFSQEVIRARKVYPEKLKQAIEMSKQITPGPRRSLHRRYDKWESEILFLTIAANPMLSLHAACEYLAEVLPHRTVKAYLSFYNREDKLKDFFSMPKEEETPVYNCKVLRILPYGAMLETTDGKKGLLHKSQIIDGYVDDVENYITENQELKAKLIYDHEGRVSFTIRDIEQHEPTIESAPIEEMISPAISMTLRKKHQMPEKKEVYKVKDIKFAELPDTLTKMIEEFEAEKEIIEARITTIKSVLETLERESIIVSKLGEVQKILSEI